MKCGGGVIEICYSFCKYFCLGWEGQVCVGDSGGACQVCIFSAVELEIVRHLGYDVFAVPFDMVYEREVCVGFVGGVSVGKADRGILGVVADC